jgi:hypothetical protein
MKYFYQLVAPIKTALSFIELFTGRQFAKTLSTEYYYNTNKVFAGYRANLKYRYWEANQITDQV